MLDARMCSVLLALAAGMLPLGGERRDTVRVTAWADSGAPLATCDLHASMNGQPSKVVSARGPKDDLIVMVVLDLTEDLGLVELAKESLAASLAELPPGTHVAVLRAQDGLSVLLDPTADRAAVRKAIMELPVSGYPGLLDTVVTSARIADAILNRANVRVAVVHVTDSSIYNYRDDYINPVVNGSDQRDISRRFPEGLIREKISKLEARLASYEAPLFIVHLNYRTDRMNEAYQSGLMQLAAATGTNAVFCRSRAEVPQAIATTLARATSHYSLVLSVPERPEGMLQVQLDNGGRALSYRSRIVLDKD